MARDYTDLGSAVLLVGYIAVGAARAVLNVPRALQPGGWYAKDIADAERRMAARNAENDRFFAEAAERAGREGRSP